MKQLRLTIAFLMLIFILTGCSLSTKDNASPKTILKNNPEADLFVVDETVYINASEIEWVKELSLTKDDILGKVKSTGVKKHFTNWAATKLEVNTEVYSEVQRKDILLVKIGDELIPYLKYVEG